MAHHQFLSEDHREKTSFVDIQNLKLEITRHYHTDYRAHTPYPILFPNFWGLTAFRSSC